MKYNIGFPGRVVVARADHGENVVAEIKKLAEKEEIKTAVIYLIGALEKASMVTGPKECSIPPEPNWTTFGDGRELIGLGTIVSFENEPLVHLHGATGRGDQTLTGCIREEARVYLVTEIIIVEILGTTASRKYHAKWEVNLLDFEM